MVGRPAVFWAIRRKTRRGQMGNALCRRQITGSASPLSAAAAAAPPAPKRAAALWVPTSFKRATTIQLPSDDFECLWDEENSCFWEKQPSVKEWRAKDSVSVPTDQHWPPRILCRWSEGVTCDMRVRLQLLSFRSHQPKKRMLWPEIAAAVSSSNRSAVQTTASSSKERAVVGKASWGGGAMREWRLFSA